MTATYTINSVAMTRVAVDVDLVESAEHGNVGEGKITVDNTDDGALAVVGHKHITVNESDCSDPLIVKGFVGQRRYYRGNPKTGANRLIDVTTLDLNALLGFKAIRSNGAGHVKTRPRETISDRLAWLIGTELSGLVADNGFVTYPTSMMDKNDYRTQKAGDVLSDLAIGAGFGYDWFVYPDPTTGAASLFFGDPNTSTDYSSTLRLSTVLSDVDTKTAATFLTGTTFAPDEPIALTRDPSEVYSSTLFVYRNGRVYRTRAATATEFAARDGVAPSSSVKRRATAIALADDFNEQHKTETDFIECNVRLPSSKVNLIRAGMRVQAKFQDFTPEGYGSDFTWFRVKNRSTKLIVSPQPAYELGLRLSPQESIGATLVQCKSTFSAAETTVTMDSNVTVGNLLVSRLITRNSETIPAMFDGTWTLLGSGAAAGINTHGAVAMYGKIATSTSPIIGREATANQMQMTVCELSGAGLSDITAFSATHQTGSVCNLGSGSGRLGLWIIAIPRGTDGARNGYTIGPASGWTVEKNQDIDNGAACAPAPPDPWWWAAKVTNATTVDITASLAATPGVGPCAGQFLGEWCAAAIFI